MRTMERPLATRESSSEQLMEELPGCSSRLIRDWVFFGVFPLLMPTMELLLVTVGVWSEQPMEETHGYTRRAERQCRFMVFPLLMPTMELLLVTVGVWSEQPMEETHGYTRRAERQCRFMVFRLQMRITERLSVNLVRYLELQMEGTTGLPSQGPLRPFRWRTFLLLILTPELLLVGYVGGLLSKTQLSEPLTAETHGLVKIAERPMFFMVFPLPM